MDSEIAILPLASFIAWWLTERLSEWVPAGHIRKLLVPVPIVLAVVLVVLAQLALNGSVTGPEFLRAVIAGLATIAMHNVRKAGEKPVEGAE